MPPPRELSFKSGAKYTVGQAFSSYTSTERQQLRQLLVNPDIFVSVSASFSTKYLDIYTSDSYVLLSTEGDVTSLLRINGIILRWSSGKFSLTLQHGVQLQVVV